MGPMLTSLHSGPKRGGLGPWTPPPPPHPTRSAHVYRSSSFTTDFPLLEVYMVLRVPSPFPKVFKGVDCGPKILPSFPGYKPVVPGGHPREVTPWRSPPGAGSLLCAVKRGRWSNSTPIYNVPPSFSPAQLPMPTAR